ncbi:hypothetical protein KUH32_10875 [Thalassococcus sp. CAU 1522]|uniref:Uncharacterized protein n=1 Tax=Thalassococcus arenae TaxID=2851652 RepID=A0ABS6N8E1_9RHOB|nr:hypothetical protein [Thalassococcus arenae]MBV2360280.1 hypothetical protein [Thalassococcus arenae]
MLKVATAVIGGFIGLVTMAGMADFGYQSYRAGQSPLEFGLEGWVASVAERGAAAGDRSRAQQNDPVTQLAALRDLLPEAPAGWQRQTWSAAQKDLLKSWSDDPAPPHEELEAIAAEEQKPRVGLFGVSDLMNKNSVTRSSREESWVYVRGRDRVVLRLRRVEPAGPPSTLVEAVALEVSNQSAWERSEMYFARYGGVVYEEHTSEFEARPYRSFSGILGPRDGTHFKITVQAKASEQTIRTILTKIGYGRLRAELRPAGQAPVSAAAEAELRAARAAEQARIAALRRAEQLERDRVERVLEGRTGSARDGRSCTQHKGQWVCGLLD